MILYYWRWKRPQASLTKTTADFEKQHLLIDNKNQHKSKQRFDLPEVIFKLK